MAIASEMTVLQIDSVAGEIQLILNGQCRKKWTFLIRKKLKTVLYDMIYSLNLML